jgi:hypothetical protein
VNIAIIASRSLRNVDAATLRQYVADLADDTTVITCGRRGGEMVVAQAALDRGLTVDLIVSADRSTLDPTAAQVCTSMRAMPDGSNAAEHAAAVLDAADAAVFFLRRPPSHPASWHSTTAPIHKLANRRGVTSALFVLEPEDGTAPLAVTPATDELVTLPCAMFVQTVYQPAPSVRVVMVSGEQSGYAVLIDGVLTTGKLVNRANWRFIRAELLEQADRMVAAGFHEIP